MPSPYLGAGLKFCGKDSSKTPNQHGLARGTSSLWKMCHPRHLLKPETKGQERKRHLFCFSNPTFLLLPHLQGYPPTERRVFVPWVAQGTIWYQPPQPLACHGQSSVRRLLEGKHSHSWVLQGTKIPSTTPTPKHTASPLHGSTAL